METPSFIYSLTWPGSNAVYVGCTQNPKMRAQNHIYGWQNAGIKAQMETCGEPIFTILETVIERANAPARECHWILKLKSLSTYPGGLNRMLTGTNCEVIAEEVQPDGEEIAAQRADLEPLVAEPMLAPLFPEPVRAQVSAMPTPLDLNLERAKLERRRQLARDLLASQALQQQAPEPENIWADWGYGRQSQSALTLRQAIKAQMDEHVVKAIADSREVRHT